MTKWFRTANRFTDPVGAKRIAQYIDLLGRHTPGHLVDLGAGHGIFSRIAVDLGWTVTAVDARDSRFPADDSVRWVVADVREFDDYADVDLVICFGLWYHLTLQDQLSLAERIAPRPLILDTHVATAELPAYQRPNQRFISDVTTHGGFTGRLYDESEFQDRATASWGNDTSFWPSVASLERQMYGAGYEVFEQVSPPYRPDRGFFVARGFAAGLGRDRLDEMVAEHNAVTDADATPAPDGPPLSFVPELVVTQPTSARPVQPATPRVPPVRTAAKQLATSLQRSAANRLARARSGSKR